MSAAGCRTRPWATAAARPIPENAPRPARLVLQVLVQPLYERQAELGVAVVIDAAHDLLGVPGGAHLAVGVAGVAAGRAAWSAPLDALDEIVGRLGGAVAEMCLVPGGDLVLPPSGSPGSATSESASCSTPAAPTEIYSPASRPG